MTAVAIHHLEDGTVYTYLVNAHWSLEHKKTYMFVNLADPADKLNEVTVVDDQYGRLTFTKDSGGACPLQQTSPTSR